MKSLLTVLLLSVCCYAQDHNPSPKIPRRFWVVAAVDFAFSNLDASLSCSMISKGVIGESETNPMYGGRKPSCGRFFLQMNAQTLGVSLLDALFWRKANRVWALPSSVDAGLHFVGAVQTLESNRIARDYCQSNPSDAICKH